MLLAKRFRILFLLAIIPVVAQTGCGAFSKRKPDQASQTLPPNTLTYTVELRPESGKPEQFTLPIVDGTSYVSEALQKVETGDQFDKRQVYVVRKAPSGRAVKMKVEQGPKGRIAAQYDYALHAGDRVVVKEDSSNVLDAMLGSLTRLR